MHGECDLVLKTQQPSAILRPMRRHHIDGRVTDGVCTDPECACLGVPTSRLAYEQFMKAPVPDNPTAFQRVRDGLFALAALAILVGFGLGLILVVATAIYRWAFPQ